MRWSLNLPRYFWLAVARCTTLGADPAIAGMLELHTSALLVTQMRDMLAYPRFVSHLATLRDTIDGCASRYMTIATLAADPSLNGAVAPDPDDNHVIVCVICAQANAIV